MTEDVRSVIPDGRQTRRSIVTKWVMDLLDAALFKYPELEDIDNPKLFETVGLGTLEDIAPRSTPSCRVQEGEEEVRDGVFNKTTKVYRIYVHFKVVKVQGVDQEELINYYFGRIVQTLVMPENFAEHVTMDVSEVGNVPVANGVTDPEPGGTIWFDIEYRHTYGNPFAE